MFTPLVFTLSVIAVIYTSLVALAQSDMPGARRHLLRLLELQPGHRYARVMLAGTVLAQIGTGYKDAIFTFMPGGSWPRPATFFSMSLATAPRSRPSTFAVISMTRCTVW